MSFTITGDKTIVRNLRRFKDDADKAIERAITRTALDVHREARKAAPSNTARLRGSIAWQYNQREQYAEVGTNVTYARFVEFGVGPAGADSEFTSLAREAMRDIGYVHGATGPFPPLDAIEKWVTQRGRPDGVDDPASAAFLIARSIYENGIRAQPFLFPALESEGPKLDDYLLKEMRRLTHGAE